MGYNLTIGEAEFDEDGRVCGAVDVHLDDAPAFGEPTDYTNQRWPSYTAWADFHNQLGISDLMRELMPSHPGYALISAAQVAVIEEKLEAYKIAHTWHEDEWEGIVNRATWMIFWMKWAIDNCKHPIFYNS